MDLYSREQVANIKEQTFAFLQVIEANQVLTITLDRAEKKNALHPQMVNELAFALQYAHYEKEVWVVLIQAKGTVFCAGADLKAMMGGLGENNSTIPSPNGAVLLGELFNKVHKPTITKVTGDVYAGGFLLLAGSNVVVAQEDIQLALPEVKRGLFPFQVMAALLKVMPARKVIDWCIRGYKLPVQEAEKFGLLTHVCKAENIDQTTQEIINQLKENSPSAIRLGLEAYEKLQATDGEHKYLMEMLMKTFATKDGQEGLKAFREKRAAKWTGE